MSPAQFTNETDPVASPEVAALEQRVLALEGGGTVDRYHRHQQMVPAAVWEVAHNLGKRPAVDVFNSSGDPVLTDVEHVDDDNLTITFSAATGGEAYCN